MNVKHFKHNNLWWIDFSIIFNSCIFLSQEYTNNYYIQLSNKTHIYYYLLILNHVNSFLFYILDITSFKLKKPNLINTHQSFFFDFQVTAITKNTNTINSISKINKGCVWLEREDRELNNTNYNNLTDSRKLLLNYNYNSNVSYSGFNQIVSDTYL